MVIIFYTYTGYGIILYVLVGLLKLIRTGKKTVAENFTPTLTVIVTAYNEAACIEEKIRKHSFT